MASASTPSVNEPHFSSHSKAKANYKTTNLRKIVNYWYISDVVTASVY